VGKNINALADTQRGNIDQVIEEAAESLHQFTVTMRSLNKTVADPDAQENLRTTLAALPKMVEDARQTIQAVRTAVVKADAALGNLSEVTEPLAKRSHSIATRLDHSIASLETVMTEMAVFSRTINAENGSLSLFVKDPQLYRNSVQATSEMALMMKNLGPLMEDLRIFSDKIARHPELLGVSGVIEPSSGIKNADDADRRGKMR
jgi:phospholipid/cholesterol/gamma-HCH transport system substrate-binding protein